MDALATTAGREPAKSKSKMVAKLREHPHFGDIQRDIIVGYKTAEKICTDYGLVKDDGSPAIFTVVRYRAWLRDKYAKWFEKVEEMEARAMRGQVVSVINEVTDKARTNHDKAVAGEKPNFEAAKDMLDVMLSANAKLGEVVNVGTAQAAQIQVNQDNRQVVLMALPKSVPARPQVLELKKA